MSSGMDEAGFLRRSRYEPGRLFAARSAAKRRALPSGGRAIYVILSDVNATFLLWQTALTRVSIDVHRENQITLRFHVVSLASEGLAFILTCANARLALHSATRLKEAGQVMSTEKTRKKEPVVLREQPFRPNVELMRQSLRDTYGFTTPPPPSVEPRKPTKS